MRYYKIIYRRKIYIGNGKFIHSMVVSFQTSRCITSSEAMNDAYTKAARQVSDAWSVEIREIGKAEFLQIIRDHDNFGIWMLSTEAYQEERDDANADS